MWLPKLPQPESQVVPISCTSCTLRKVVQFGQFGGLQTTSTTTYSSTSTKPHTSMSGLTAGNSDCLCLTALRVAHTVFYSRLQLQEVGLFDVPGIRLTSLNTGHFHRHGHQRRYFARPDAVRRAIGRECRRRVERHNHLGVSRRSQCTDFV